MHDGRTRRLPRREPATPVPAFFREVRAVLRILAGAGAGAGSDLPLDRERAILGRGPGVDLQIDDPAMSREHAAFPLADSAFRMRDLGSTNGVLVNGRETLACELESGDRIEIGEHVFEYVVEPLVRDSRAEPRQRST